MPEAPQRPEVARKAGLGAVAQGEQGLLAPQPAAGLGHLRISSGLIVWARGSVSRWAKVQYEQTSRQRLVSGMKTLRE